MAEDVIPYRNIRSIRIFKLYSSAPDTASILINGIIYEFYVLDGASRDSHNAPVTYFQAIAPVAVDYIVVDRDVFKEAPFFPFVPI